MNLEELKSDISKELAYRAHAGTSFVPDKRAAQVQDDYAHTLLSDYNNLAAIANTEEKRAILESEFPRYRKNFRSKYSAWLVAKSRVISVMVAGPSNFPSARNAKRNATEDKRREEFTTWREKALKAIRRKLTPEDRPIMAGDGDAVSRLEAEIEKAERWQALMKAANKIVRQKPKHESTPEKIEALVSLGMSAAAAAKLFEPDFCGRYGFAGYELTNNNANIRRLRARLAEVCRNKATEDTEIEGDNARLEDAPGDNRVRLYFPGKPDATIRTQLKQCGFRWSPSLGCWQAYRNHRALEAARKFAGIESGTP